MSKTAQDLIQERTLETIQLTDPVRSAVQIMFEHEYSQLPVVDDQGCLKGIFTEQRFTEALYYGNADNFLTGNVGEWMTEATTVHPSMSVYVVMRVLTDPYAVVVVDDKKPMGIITDYDIALFLSNWSKGMSLVEDIEKMLRKYIEGLIGKPDLRKKAISNGETPSKRMPKPKPYERLTFHDHLKLITDETHWSTFEPYLGPASTFCSYLKPVGPIRNQIAHFRGDPTSSQYRKLEAARNWLLRRPEILTDRSNPRAG